MQDILHGLHFMIIPREFWPSVITHEHYLKDVNASGPVDTAGSYVMWLTRVTHVN